MLRVLRAVHAFETSTRPIRGNRLMYAGREPTSVRRALGRDDACAPPCSAEVPIYRFTTRDTGRDSCGWWREYATRARTCNGSSDDAGRIVSYDASTCDPMCPHADSP